MFSCTLLMQWRATTERRFAGITSMWTLDQKCQAKFTIGAKTFALVWRNSIPADGNIFSTSKDATKTIPSIEMEFEWNFYRQTWDGSASRRSNKKHVTLDLYFPCSQCALLPVLTILFSFQLRCYSKRIWSAFRSARRSRLWLPQSA